MPELENAFTNFRLVLADLLEVFARHAQKRDGIYLTSKFYKAPEWNPDKYSALSKTYDEHVELVQELTFEVTRAGNLICAQFDCI